MCRPGPRRRSDVLPADPEDAMRTHEHAWGTSSVSSSPPPGAETRALDIPEGKTRCEPSSFRYDPGLVGDFYVEWQQAATLAPAGRIS